MKKTIFLGIAALLALALFSCGDDISLGDPSLQKEKVGSAGITLSGPELSASRALIGATGEAGTTLYEATFIKGTIAFPTKVLRTSWNYARKGRIQIEPDSYIVILLAGRNSDKTLLGVGRATGIVGGGSANGATLAVTITTTTTDLNFEVYPLMNKITYTGTPATPGASAGDPDEFAISDSTFTTEVMDNSTTLTFPIQTTKDEIGNTIPIFMLKQNGVTKAAWKFGIGDLPGGSNDLMSLFAPTIFVNDVPDIFNTGYTIPDSLEIPQKLAAAVFTPAAGFPTSGTAIPTTGTFSMDLTAPLPVAPATTSDGVAQIAFEVPVVALTSAVVAPDNPIVWSIRGGLSNGLLDAGTAPNVAASGKLGGAILVGFGNLSSFPWINLNPGW